MEWRKLKIALFTSTYLLLIVWLAYIVELLVGGNISKLGILPRDCPSVGNFLISPFLHSNLEHLLNNSLAFYFLSLASFHFYGGIALRVMLGGVFSGLLVWIAGREAYHIGLSGVCYTLASFLFFSGIIRKNMSLSTISLLVVFLQSEMVWGLFPSLNEPLHISWESHLAGGTVGFILALAYRKKGPPNDKTADDLEDDENESVENGASVEDADESEHSEGR